MAEWFENILRKKIRVDKVNAQTEEKERLASLLNDIHGKNTDNRALLFNKIS